MHMLTTEMCPFDYGLLHSVDRFGYNILGLLRWSPVLRDLNLPFCWDLAKDVRA